MAAPLAPPLAPLFCLVLLLLLLTASRGVSAKQGQTQTLWLSPPRLMFRHKTCALPVDNVTGLLGGDRQVPWTNRPYCAPLRSVGKRDKHCVFSSSTYNLNKGLAIISTPGLAAGMVDAVFDAPAAWRHRRHLAGYSDPERSERPERERDRLSSKNSSASQEPARSRESPLPYELAHLPGKGTGVLANRTIKQFEVFMVGFPALIVNDDFFPKPDGGPPPAEAPSMYERALSQLGDRERVLSLAKSESRVGHVAEDIMRINSFGVVINDVKHKALYPEVARINHACDPNAMARFNPRTLALDVIATRDIPEGEEVQISYITVGLPYSYRQRQLSNWGFKCTCPLCRAPEEVKAFSDGRRERLAEIQKHLNDDSLTYDSLRELAAEMEEIATDERLVQKMGEYHHDLMSLFFDYGDVGSALYHARASSRYCDSTADSEGMSCTLMRTNIKMLESWVKVKEEEARQEEAREVEAKARVE